MSFLTFLLIITALSSMTDIQSIQQREENSIGQPKSESSSLLPRGCGCLMLLMCIGVMGAIALPSFLTSAKKAKQSEAKQYVGSMNRAQQAQFAENSKFSTSIPDLGIGIKTETTNYKYSIFATQTAAFNYGVSKHPKNTSYVGGVFVVPAKEVEQNAAKDELKTIAILCKADSPGSIQPAEPTYQNGKTACGKGTTAVTK